MTQIPPNGSDRNSSYNPSLNDREEKNVHGDSYNAWAPIKPVPNNKIPESGLPLQPSPPPRPKPKASTELVQGRKISILQRFYDLPISRKTQIISLLTLVSLGGILGLGSLVLVKSLRAQLVNQATSQLAVTEINYNIKIDEMSLGFGSQSENSVIVAAAQASASGQPLTLELRSQVKAILQNEVKARNIEYATLVGKDLRIIANANANRTGEIFDPNNLVSQTLKYALQIKTSETVSWAELAKESPPLSDDLTNQDALIRYTLTPVKDPKTGSVIAALVSGDLVNGKLLIVQKTVKTFLGKGYSAIYLRQPTGKFSLATSFEKTNPLETKVNIPLSDTSLLTEAAEVVGEPVGMRSQVENRTYTLAAKALPNFVGEPVAILVYGDPEIALGQILQNSLLTQGGLSILGLGVVVVLAGTIGRAIAKPVKQLQRITQEFSEGKLETRAEVLASDEVGQLATTFNELAERIQDLLQKQAAETRRTHLLAEIARARSSSELESLLNQLLAEVREPLKTERVVIYRLYPDGRGYMGAESVLPGWPSALGDKIEDPCIGDELLQTYKKGRVVAIRNVLEAGLSPEHMQLMQRLQIKSNLVAPILQGEELYGLLIAHHCNQTHDWQQSEIDYLVQIANQIGLALSRFALLEKKQAEAERQRQQNEEIQYELSQLLSDVEAASTGDLTVRANITAGEIGIVADFFNSIIESLRDIVTQVKQAASQVNISVGENEGAIRLLASEALNQATQISQTLNSVEDMTLSIQEVADNARAAAEVARSASDRAQTGGEAIDRMVKSILKLRLTVAETAKKVKRLGESSQQISQVISLINQIALKTNLLAINASIEAAHAGEEGQGFAVVAEEVGELAEQSAAATKEIEQIVAKIQLGTSEVVQAMELGTTQVVEGTRLVEETKQSFEQIVEVSRQIDQLLQFISSATISQAETSQVVRKLMEDIAQISERTSDSSDQVSSSLQQTVEIAQQLQASVGTFKVSAPT
ncbi:MAG: methyl-accepting chemotaxis protein [Xenococcaceae cyanobacterium]